MIGETRKRSSRRAIRNGGQHLEVLFDHCPDIVYLKDLSGKYVYVNRRFCEAAGKNAEMIIGRTSAELFGDEIGGEWADHDRETIERREAVERRKRHARMDGTIRNELVRKFPILDERGELFGIGGIDTDISEQTPIEEALRESEERLRAVIANVPGTVFRRVLHPDGHDTFEYVSEGDGDFLGLETGDFEAFLNTLHPDDRELFLAALRDSAENLAAMSLDLRHVLADGQTKWMRTISHPFRRETGEIVWDGLPIEITEQRRMEEALRESEAHFRAIADNLPGIVFRRVTHADGRMTYRFISARCRELLGFAPEAIKDDPELLMRITHPDDRPGWTAAMVAAIRDLTPLDFTRRVRTASGDIKWFRTMSQPQRLANGDVVFDGITLDVTARRSAETALRESEARFRAVVDNAPYAIYLKDRDGHYTLVNPSFCATHGLSAKAVLGKTGGEIFGAEDADSPTEHDCEVMERRATVNRERAIPHADGTVHDLIETKFPILDQDGELVGIGGIDTEITRRKQVERALRESEERYRRLVELSPDAILVHSEGRFTFVNAAGADIFGAERPDDMVGRPAISIVHPDFRDVVQERIRHVSAGGQVPFNEERLLRLDGSPFDAEVAGIPFDVGGKPAAQVIVRDITERKRIEEELRQAQKMEAVGQLTGGVAHDFNNLLAVILGNLELLDETLEGREGQREFVRQALQVAERGANLVDRLLVFSRRQPLEPRLTDLNGVVEGITDLLRRALGETVEMETALAGETWPTLIDQGQLENTLINLAINAQDAMPDGGRLTIETANTELGENIALLNPDLEPGQFVMLAVSDTGTGMPPEIVDRVFEPFFTTKAAGEGSGLGLSMVYGFVRQSGGHVEIDSELGRGTTVRIYLPRARDDAAAAGVVPPVAADLRGHGETVLVVEDNAAMRQLAVNVLRSLGYDTIEAGDGASALAALEGARDAALLFSDVVLPGGMNGPELAREARRRRPGLKVLFMSGYAEIAGVHAGQSIEGAGLVRKPFRKAELAERIGAVLAT